MAKPVKSLKVCKRCKQFRQSFDPFKNVHSYQCLLSGIMKLRERKWFKYFVVPKECSFFAEHVIMGQYGGK